MLSKTMEDSLNEQVNREMYSAYLYMSMSAYAAHEGLKGFANWFMVQYHEEMLHAMRLYEFILHRGGSVTLKVIAQPPATFASPLEMFQKTLEHEQYITKSINDWMDQAIAEKDHATQIFLQWYVTEQVEEEGNDQEILAQLKLIGANTQGLMLLDKDLAARITTVPTEFSKGVEAAMKVAGV
jgi:ferritin